MDSGQQRYARPPTGAFLMPGIQLPQEMGGQAVMPMQHQMMMAQQFPQYGIMMPAGHVMPVPMPMQPMGMAPQLSQMLAESARGGRGSNVFFKTRLCNKWRAGTCPFGDKCTYAHGQHELRYIPPELLSQLEREQHTQEHSQRQPPSSPGPPHQMPSGRAPPKHNGTAAAAAGDRGQVISEKEGEGVEAHRNKSHLYYKTRLCIRFMQTGYCARGNACTFAHGYEDLRLVGHPQGGAAELIEGGGAAERTRDPRQPQIVGGGRTGVGQLLTPTIDRARGVSALLGIGEAQRAVDMDALQAAEENIRSGDAFRGSAYADSAEDFVNTPE